MIRGVTRTMGGTKLDGRSYILDTPVAKDEYTCMMMLVSISPLCNPAKLFSSERYPLLCSLELADSTRHPSSKDKTSR